METYVFQSSYVQGQSSRELIQRCLSKYLNRPQENWTLGYGPHGQPYVKALPQVHLSVTHSGTYWLCALARHPVGLDLQQHQPCSAEAISRRFFHEREDAFLRDREYEPFFSVWTAKESYLKYTGRGITGGLSHFSVVSDEGIHAAETIPLRFLPFAQGYTLCLCGHVERLHWVRLDE